MDMCSSVGAAGRVLFGLLVGLVLCTVVKADTLHIHNNAAVYGLSGHLALYEDSTQLTLQQVAQLAVTGQFAPNISGKAPSFGITPNTIWATVTLQSQMAAPAAFVWHIDDPAICDARLYAKTPDGHFQVLYSGIARASAQKAIPGNHVAFPLTLTPGTPLTLYLKVTSNNFLSLPTRLVPAGQYQKQYITERFILGLLYGMLLVILVYNLFLYFTTRFRAFLYYVLATFFFGLVAGTYDGITPVVFHWLVVATNAYHDILTTGGSNICTLLFMVSFLNLRQVAPRYTRWVYGAMGLYVAIMLLALWWPATAFGLMVNSSLVMIVLLIAGGWLALRAAVPEARYFLLAYFILCVFVGISFLMLFKVLPNNYFTLYSLHMGYIGSLMILSFALGQKINAIRLSLLHEEREKKQLIAERNKDLEQMVARRTQEISGKEANLRAILNNNDNIIWQVNTRYELIDHNSAFLEHFRQLFGQPPAPGTDITTCYASARNRQLWRQRYSHALAGRHETFTDIYQFGQEAVVIETSTYPIQLYGEIKGVSLFSKDISERRQAENKLAHQNEELMKVNEELDRFVYSASHDLKAPITSVQGLMNVIKMEDHMAAKSHYFAMMQQSLGRLSEFIDDIANYARNKRAVVACQRVHLRPLILQVFEKLQHVVHHDKLVHKVEVNERVPLYSDPDRIDLILTSIIANAMYYTDPHKPTSHVLVRACVTNGHASIAIEDNGQGIDAEHLGKIFNMFYRANEHTTGSGLGLYIAEESARKLAGSIQVQSTKNVGSTFTVTVKNQHKPAAQP